MWVILQIVHSSIVDLFREDFVQMYAATVRSSRLQGMDVLLLLFCARDDLYNWRPYDGMIP
jgi:hypothetical protein